VVVVGVLLGAVPPDRDHTNGKIDVPGQKRRARGVIVVAAKAAAGVEVTRVDAMVTVLIVLRTKKPIAELLMTRKKEFLVVAHKPWRIQPYLTTVGKQRATHNHHRLYAHLLPKKAVVGDRSETGMKATKKRGDITIAITKDPEVIVWKKMVANEREEVTIVMMKIFIRGRAARPDAAKANMIRRLIDHRADEVKDGSSSVVRLLAILLTGTMTMIENVIAIAVQKKRNVEVHHRRRKSVAVNPLSILRAVIIVIHRGKNKMILLS